LLLFRAVMLPALRRPRNAAIPNVDGLRNLRLHPWPAVELVHALDDTKSQVERFQHKLRCLTSMLPPTIPKAAGAQNLI
jgi:hypothetical protein